MGTILFLTERTEAPARLTLASLQGTFYWEILELFMVSLFTAVFLKILKNKQPYP